MYKKNEPRSTSAHFFCPLVWLAVTLNLENITIYLLLTKQQPCSQISSFVYENRTIRQIYFVEFHGVAIVFFTEGRYNK